MDIFEKLLAETPKKISAFERKVTLQDTPTILYGPPESGKTTAAMLYASQKKGGYVYVNLKDLRLKNPDIVTIYKLSVQRGISTVILDGHKNSDFSVNEKIQTIFITDRPPVADEIVSLKTSGLDFEEYLSFFERHNPQKKEEDLQDERIGQIFSHYIKDGVNPQKIFLPEHKKIRFSQETIHKIAENQTEFLILCALFKKTASKLSLLQIFTILKNEHKISKDFFYDYCEKLKDMGIVHFVEKLDGKNAPKKIYPYDFAFKSAVDFEKDFSAVFENMVFLELNSRGYKTFYIDELGLYVEGLAKAVLAKPFLSDIYDRLSAKLFKKAAELGIKEINTITVGNEDFREQNGITIEAVPFWQWALSL